jgi:SAM-dependent methyltransferase
MAVGSDINEALLTQAQARRQGRRRLLFAKADVFHLPFGPGFDIVTAARVLQWLSDPRAAVVGLAGAVRAGGMVLLLDYDHEAIEWSPPPPASMSLFYAAFLEWRATAGFDNRIAQRLASLVESAGASAIIEGAQHERTTRADADFVMRAGIWADVAATRGHQMVADGFVSEPERRAAESDYREWIRSRAESMTLHLTAVEGIIRAARPG